MKKLNQRIKSAAFLHRNNLQQLQQLKNTLVSHQKTLQKDDLFLAPKVTEIHQMPLSQSKYSQYSPNRVRAQSAHMASSRMNNSSISIWRKVHSSNSQFRLKSLSKEQQPIRLNLQQKVIRIKQRHQEQQQNFRQTRKSIEKQVYKRLLSTNRIIQQKQLKSRISTLIKTFQQAKNAQEERYAFRLKLKLRIKGKDDNYT